MRPARNISPADVVVGVPGEILERADRGVDAPVARHVVTLGAAPPVGPVRTERDTELHRSVPPRADERVAPLGVDRGVGTREEDRGQDKDKWEYHQTLHVLRVACGSRLL